MDTSILLAKVVGIYFVVICLLVLIKRKFFQQVLQSFASSKAVIFLGSILALIIGLLLVISHNVWETNWRVIITIAGWLALIKGILLMVMPEKFMNWSAKAFKTVVPVGCIIMIIVGAYLIYIGFFVA